MPLIPIEAAEWQSEVTLRLTTEGLEPRVALEWRESGVEMLDDNRPRHCGYGFRLIERALPYQQRARTRLDHGPDRSLRIQITRV